MTRHSNRYRQWIKSALPLLLVGAVVFTTYLHSAASYNYGEAAGIKVGVDLMQAKLEGIYVATTQAEQDEIMKHCPKHVECTSLSFPSDRIVIIRRRAADEPIPNGEADPENGAHVL